MTTRRQEKVSALVLRELSTLIARKVSDPRVKWVHIVSVDVSPDFHLARVAYSTLNDEITIDEVQQGLDSAKPFLRHELKKQIQLRKIPELAFSYDPSIKEGDRLLGLLRDIVPPADK